VVTNSRLARQKNALGESLEIVVKEVVVEAARNNESRGFTDVSNLRDILIRARQRRKNNNLAPISSASRHSPTSGNACHFHLNGIGPKQPGNQRYHGF
jgi:hypothetical protein